jgi:hypothetical protein
MGSYVGKAGAAGATPPPGSAGSGSGDDDHRGRKVALVAVAAALLLVVGVVAVLLATQKGDDSALKAGQDQRTRNSSIARSSHDGDAADDTTGSSSGSTSGGSKSTGKSGSSGSKSSGSTGSSSSGTTGSTSGNTGSSGSGSSGSKSSGSKSSGSTGHAKAPSGGTKTTTPSTARPLSAAQLSVSTLSLRVTGDQGASVVVKNTGEKTLYWSVGSASMSGSQVGQAPGSLHFTATSGSLAGGASAVVGVTWSGGDEGEASGTFHVKGAGSDRTVSVTGDSRVGDTVLNVRQKGCASTCANGSYVTIQLDPAAGGTFATARPSTITMVRLDGGFAGEQVCTIYDGAAKNYYLSGTRWTVTCRLMGGDFTYGAGGTKVSVWVTDASGAQTSPHTTLTILS